MGSIARIVTHVQPHLDELVAIWLLKRFGEEIFPGVETAETVYILNDSDGSPTQGDIDELWIGIGGGRFDEHPTSNQARKAGCAATLVAKTLGVRALPELKEIIDYVERIDTKGGREIFSLADQVSIFQFSQTNKKVMEKIFDLLDAAYKKQWHFHHVTAEIFKSAKIFTIKGPDSRPLKVAVIQTDDPLIVSYGFSWYGGAQCVIARQPSGNTQILNRKVYKSGKDIWTTDITDLVGAIRQAECQAKGLPPIDETILTNEGKVRSAEEWFYHLGGQMLLNGSQTAAATPTNLSLETLTQLVLNHLRFKRTANVP